MKRAARYCGRCRAAYAALHGGLCARIWAVKITCTYASYILHPPPVFSFCTWPYCTCQHSLAPGRCPASMPPQPQRRKCQMCSTPKPPASRAAPGQQQQPEGDAEPGPQPPPAGEATPAVAGRRGAAAEGAGRGSSAKRARLSVPGRGRLLHMVVASGSSGWERAPAARAGWHACLWAIPLSHIYATCLAPYHF